MAPDGDRGLRADATEGKGELLDEVANPIEQLKLLSGNDDEIARYLDALEVTTPRERELLTEIARTRPLARPERFPVDHRQMVEALESLARHGYRGSSAGRRLGPLQPVARWGVQLVARYLVVSHIRNVSTTMRNLYALREIQALPGSFERRELRRARMDGERMVEALKRNSIGVPTFLVGGAAFSILATIGRASGLLEDTRWALAHRRRRHADRADRVVDDPARRGAGLPSHPARDGGPDQGAVAVDRLVRPAAERPDADVRDRRA